MEKAQALAIIAREIRLKRYKQDLWLQATRCAEAGGEAEKHYARLRFEQLLKVGSKSSSGRRSFEKNVAYRDVLEGLKGRAIQYWVEGLILLLVVIVGLLTSIQLIL